MIDAGSTAKRAIGVWSALMLTLFIADISVVSGNMAGPWLVTASAGALVGTLLAMAMGRRIRCWGPVGVAAAFVVIGVLTGAVQFAVASMMSQPLASMPWLMVTSAGLTIGLLGLGAVLFDRVLQEQRELRRAALDEAIALAEARDDVAEIAQQMQVMLSQDIDEALTPARISIAERLQDQERALDGAEWERIAAQLRAAVQETVSPLSRRLWVPVLPGEAPLRIRDVLGNIVREQPFRPLAMSSIAVVSLFASVIDLAGWAVGLSLLGVGIVFLVIALTVGNALLRRWPSHHAAIFITGAVVIQAGHLLMIPLRRLAGLPPYSVIEFLLASIIGVVLVFVTSGFGSFRSYRADIARVLESTLDADLTASIAASRQVAQLARESARILHGTVQTRLIACAVAIEQAAGTRDVDAFQRALSEAHAVLAQSTRFVEDDTTTLIEEVQRKVGLWSGLCVIDTIVSPDLAASGGRLARDIGRVVEEGVSNAIRHGGASVIGVRVGRGPDTVVVTVEDNGRGPGGGQPGLGSALLGSVCSSWSLEGLNQGARLTAVVPS